MTYRDFLDALGERESSGDYTVVNSYGYLGKYQFGELALIDVGYYTADETSENDWQKGYWTGKNGIDSKADFLADGAAQEQAIRIYGFDATHTGVLHEPAVAKLVIQVLEASRADARVAGAH